MVTVPQNNRGTTSLSGGVTGSGFRPGVSGNPGGRPKGLARRIREEIGADGLELVTLMLEIARDERASRRDRIAAATWLADRGWGRTRLVVHTEIDVDAIPMFDPDKLSIQELETMERILEKAQPDR